MDYKPSDFFIGVIDFFGILVPGAVLLFLDGFGLPDKLQLRPLTDRIWQSAAFLIGSYVLGHFLLAAGELLQGWLPRYKSSAEVRFYKRVEEHLNPKEKPPEEVSERSRQPTGEEARTDGFYRAYSSLRLNKPAAAAEVERQMADYKLFRSLALVFALDFAMNYWLKAHWPRLLVAGFLVVLTAVRYCLLLSWTYRITFEYYDLLTKPLVVSGSSSPR